MQVTTTKVTTQPAILRRHLEGTLYVPVTIDSTAFTDGVCKAGSPIDADGKIANTNKAKGILLNDVYQDNPNGSLVTAFGVINLTNAEANSGLTIAAAVKTALSNLVFEADE